MESKLDVHHGPYESIPASASPGLIFLSRFLPAMDSLDQESNPMSCFFDRNASISVNSDPPTAASQAVPLLEVRGRHLSRFHHETHTSWDMDLNPSKQSDSRLARTIMFEATSESILKDDPDSFPVKVCEFNILDLAGPNDSDLRVVGMRMYLDSKPVQARAAFLQTSAFGESKREADG